jgi:hypothetical protein
MRSSPIRLFRVVATAVAIAALAPRAHAATAFAADIPFRDCDGLICIDVSLDGAAPRTLMLDTGNAHSTLITDIANDLSWTLKPAERDDKPVPGIYRAGEHRVALGDVHAAEPFFAFDRKLLGEYVPPVDGSLSYDFFQDRVLEIDYPHRRIRVSNVVATPIPDKPSTTGSLKLITFGEHGPPVVIGTPFTVAGKNVRAQIDTVFTGTMLIYDSAVDMLGLHKEGTPELFRYTDGGVDLLAASSGDVGFGKLRLASGAKALYFVGDGKNPVHQPDAMFEATVGNALFAHSVVTLDFHAMTLDVRNAAP